MISRLAYIFSLVLFAKFAHAQIAVSLPLDGYYRPGRYFPILLQAPSEQAIKLQASGALPTIVDSGHGTSWITPMLSAGPDVGTITVDGGAVVAQLPRALQSHDVLVGILGGAAQESAARKLIPGTHPLLVQLDPTHPLAGPAMAWQSLDAVVLDRWPGNLQLTELPALLAGGMTIAVTASSPPDSALPWRPFADGWALRPNLAGPLGCDGNDEAYFPSGMWHPDLPASDRFRIIAVGVVAVPLLLMTQMLRTRGCAVAWSLVILLILGFTMTMPAIRFDGRGAIEVSRVGWEQSDQWTYFAARHPTNFKTPLSSPAWPIFDQPSQAEELQCTMRDHDGIALQFILPADHRLATVRRLIRPSIEPTIETASAHAQTDTNSPMARLAQSLYRDAGLPQRTPGEPLPAVDAAQPMWPTVKCRQ